VPRCALCAPSVSLCCLVCPGSLPLCHCIHLLLPPLLPASTVRLAQGEDCHCIPGTIYITVSLLSLYLPRADCRKALPVITAAWEKAQSQRKSQERHKASAREGEPAPVLVKAWVGDRAYWKGPNNPFKILPFWVTCVPTLLKWDYGDLSKGINLGKALPGRLGDEECKNSDLVERCLALPSSDGVPICAKR